LVKAIHAAGARDPFTAAEASVDGGTPEAFQSPSLDLLQRICRSICDFAESTPLVVGVDDVHFADEQSLRCLSFLIRRIQRCRIIVVLTETSCYRRETDDAARPRRCTWPTVTRVELGPPFGRGASRPT